MSPAKIIFVLLSLCACTALLSQRQNIRVMVKNEVDRKPLAKATVVLVNRRDSALADFGITDSLGSYLFKNISIDKTGLIMVSSTGYKEVGTSLALPDKASKTRLPDTTIEVLLIPYLAQLQDVVVTGQASPIKMNKDTLEFDAAFFKSHPNAVLEDLLRKLPGVEIRNKNEVYVNGQRVNRILIDGKEFFSSDPIVILKNLPAEIIAKVQVADEKNTIAKETREQKDIPKTINLKLKKEMRQGAFGKFYAGKGTDDRYEGGGILNVFRDTLQVSLIGSSNNQGRDGFSMGELNELGGFDRSEEVGGLNAGNLSRGYREGIETETIAGTNVNYNIGKNVQLNGQYFLNRVQRRTGDDGNSQQFLGDSALLSENSFQSNNTVNTHKAGAGLRWKQDSTGYLTLQVNTEFRKSDQQQVYSGKSFSQSVPVLSKSYGSELNKDNTHKIAANADYSKTFVRLHLDWSVNASYTHTGAGSLVVRNNTYFRIINNFLPDSVRQLRNELTPGHDLNIRNNFAKTWKDKHTLSWEASYEHKTDRTGGDTYQYFSATAKDELVPGLSVKLIQLKQWVTNSFYYRYSYKDFTIQPGIALHTLFLQNSYNYDTIPKLNRTYHLFNPVFNIRYKDFGFGFNQSLREPYSWALRPVTDSSNPLYTTIGNPNLKPSTSTDYQFSYYKYINRSKINISGWAGISREKDGIGNARQVFPDGKTISAYINLKAINNYNLSVNINKSYSKNNWEYSGGMNTGFYITQSPVLLNQVYISTTNNGYSGSVNMSIGYKDNYRIEAGYRLRINRTRSDDATVQSASISQHSIYGKLHAQLLNRLSWDANINYNINPGLREGYRTKWLFCDMAITASFLKNNRGQLKVSGFDLFNQNQGIFQFAYQNYLTEQKSLVQQRYFMLTFLYTLRKL